MQENKRSYDGDNTQNLRCNDGMECAQGEEWSKKKYSQEVRVAFNWNEARLRHKAIPPGQISSIGKGNTRIVNYPSSKQISVQDKNNRGDHDWQPINENSCCLLGSNTRSILSVRTHEFIVSERSDTLFGAFSVVPVKFQ